MASSEFRLPPKIQLNQGLTKQPYTKSKERNNGQASTKKGQAWTNEEHTEFLKGLKQLGKGRWREISKYFVPSRSPTQVASHAQKFQQRIALKGSAGKRRSRFAAIEQGLFGDSQQGPESSIARAQGLLGLQPDAEGRSLPDVLFQQSSKHRLAMAPPLNPQSVHGASRPSAYLAPPRPLYEHEPLRVAPLVIPPDPGPFMAGLLRPLAQKPSPYTQPLVNTLMQEREEFYASNMKGPGPVMPSVGSAFRPTGAYWRALEASGGTLQSAGGVFVH